MTKIKIPRFILKEKDLKNTASLYAFISNAIYNPIYFYMKIIE